MFQYLLNASYFFYFTFNCAYLLLLLFTGKCINLYQKLGYKLYFLCYVCAPLQGFCVKDTDHGFVLLSEYNSDFANKTQNNKFYLCRSIIFIK